MAPTSAWRREMLLENQWDLPTALQSERQMAAMLAPLMALP